MIQSTDPVRLTVIYEPDERGWTRATIPAVPGTISMGRTRHEARDNVLDALREMLAVRVQAGQGAVREEVEVRLDLARSHNRGHAR
jgi:predicted RNase H-like HicB family nuclease